MLDVDTKKRIDDARDILVGKLPDPKSQVEQITIALIYKFMDDMDKESIELGGKAKFFTGEYQRYAWSKIFDPRVSGFELVNIYGEAIQRMNQNPNIPQLFRDIFKNAYLPYRDPETLKSFLKTINDFHYDHSERLGDAFEYLLSVLGSQGEAGQFRTPRHIIDFMIEIIDPQKTETILDPACGTAGFLISSYKHILKKNSKNYDPENDPKAFELHGINLEEITVNNKKYRGERLTSDDKERLANNILGYDISPDMVRLSLVNMYLHGFSHPRIYEYDTLTSEDKWNEFADVILANPPFMSPKGGIKPHKRFSIESKRSEVLFVDYIAEHLTPQGRSCVIVPEGIIFQTQTAYKDLRKMLIEKDCLVGVISLPAGVFNPYSGVKTSILWLDKNLAKRTNKILFVKIENDGFDLGAQRRPIKDNDLPTMFSSLQKYKRSLETGNTNIFNINNQKNILLVDKKQLAYDGIFNLSLERYQIEESKGNKYKWVELSEAAIFIKDGDWIETKDQSEKGIRLIQTGNVGEGEYLDKVDKARFISEETFKKLNCTEIFPGDILISRLPDPVGRACEVPKLPTKMITAVDCTIIRFDKQKIIPSLFVFYTRCDDYYRSLSRYLTGASRQRISRTNLEKIKIPLPLLSIQETIVLELESYQKIIDGARQIIDNYAPHIEIDPKWPIVELGDVCDFKRGPFGGSLKKEIFVEKGYCVYEQSHAISGSFEPVRYFINSDKFKEMKQFEVKPGDLIMSCSGTMGKIAVAPEGVKPGIINQALLKLTPTDKIDKYYLTLILEGVSFQKTLQEFTYGAAIKNVASVSILKKLKVPLPEIKIQRNIVKGIVEEQKSISESTRLIEIFETKIKNRIAKIWGEK